MSIQSLLGDISASSFVEQYFHRLPFSLAGAASSLCPLGSWERLNQILDRPDADVMVVRDGQSDDELRPTTVGASRMLVQQGYTILVRHAEQHDQQLKQLADAFQHDFQAPVNIHIYATPGGGHGFSWHYDVEDVFIVQTAGNKEYSLRKNTVHPWPLLETIPRDMHYEREIMPLMRVLLGAGDWLYIPCGYWHKAEARGDETSISLALGLMSPAAIDVYDFLRQRLAHSLMWRQRLPIRGDATSQSADKLAAQYQELFQLLADDLQKTLSDSQFVNDFLTRNRASDPARP